MKPSTQPDSPDKQAGLSEIPERLTGAKRDGRRFVSGFDDSPPNWRAILRWQFTRKPPEWPGFIDVLSGPAPPAAVDSGRLRITFITHATCLIQMDGRNILTDPIWSYRAGPTRFLGNKRHVAPGLAFDQLPDIDLLLVSHNHYDHMDVPTLQSIAQRHQPDVCTGLGNGKILQRADLRRITECDWWESASHGPLKVTYVPSRHWSARGPFDRCRSLWGGFVVEGPSGKVYFAGDTGYGDHFSAIKRKFPDIRLALLPIGAFQPRWFMKKHHMSPEDALEAHRSLKPAVSVGIHFDTFALADEAFEEAPSRLVRAVESSREPLPPFWLLSPGEGRQVPYRISPTEARRTPET